MEIAWNKVQFATCPSVWPVFPLVHFFLLHMIPIPVLPSCHFAHIYSTSALYLAYLVRRLSTSLVLCTDCSSYAFRHGLQPLAENSSLYDNQRLSPTNALYVQACLCAGLQAQMSQLLKERQK